MERHGLRPGGDDGYFQRVPLARSTTGGRERITLLRSWEEYEAAPQASRYIDANVIGVLPGADLALRDEAIVVAAHYDHVGIGRPDETGDSIYNGADDDASGVVAMLEIARALADGPAPRRTIVFLAAAAEEVGMLGTVWYLDHPTVPLDQTVGMLAIEMIGRPDELAGGPGRAWLTGYERSTMGDVLRDNGIRSCPILAPSRTSSYGATTRPSPTAGSRRTPSRRTGCTRTIIAPRTRSTRSTSSTWPPSSRPRSTPSGILADGSAPEWHPGGKPEPRRR